MTYEDLNLMIRPYIRTCKIKINPLPLGMILDLYGAV